MENNDAGGRGSFIGRVRRLLTIGRRAARAVPNGNNLHQNHIAVEPFTTNADGNDEDDVVVTSYSNVRETTFGVSGGNQEKSVTKNVVIAREK